MADETSAFLTVAGLSKSYTRNVVLDNISLELHPGRVYGLLGENGAGKTTLAKILSGITDADSGQILIDGCPQYFKAPKDALELGIAIITQEQTLALDRSVAENVFYGQLDSQFGWVNERALRARFNKLRDEVGFTDLHAATTVRQLPLAKRQQVEIMRALAWGSRLIIMDEPTAILSAVETEVLLELIRKLAVDGHTILLISHYLEEVLAVTDEVFVLRDGAVTFSGPTEGQTLHTLTKHMVGRSIDFEHQVPPPIAEDARVLLEVKDLCRLDGVGPISFTIRAGEIVGMAGLVGAGRTKTARAIFGVDAMSSGEVVVDGELIDHPNPRRSIKHGLAMVSENRKEDGLALIHSIRENSSIVVRNRYARFGWRAIKPERRDTAAASESMSVKSNSIEQPIWQLSGGNQQKVLFAKWVMSGPKVLIIDEPTRGVDVGAKAQIYEIINNLARQGIGILIISSEIEEVMGLSHRVLAVSRGQITKEFTWGNARRREVIAAAFGDTDEKEA